MAGVRIRRSRFISASSCERRRSVTDTSKTRDRPGPKTAERFVHVDPNSEMAATVRDADERCPLATMKMFACLRQGLLATIAWAACDHEDVCRVFACDNERVQRSRVPSRARRPGQPDTLSASLRRPSGISESPNLRISESPNPSRRASAVFAVRVRQQLLTSAPQASLLAASLLAGGACLAPITESPSRRFAENATPRPPRGPPAGPAHAHLERGPGAGYFILMKRGTRSSD